MYILYFAVAQLVDCATSRKVAGSIPDGAIGIFHWHNPSGRTMALELTQPLTEMSTRNVTWGLRRPVRRADNLTTFMCRLSWNLGASTSWNPQGLSRPVMGLLYLYILCLDQHFQHYCVVWLKLGIRKHSSIKKLLYLTTQSFCSIDEFFVCKDGS